MLDDNPYAAPPAIDELTPRATTRSPMLNLAEATCIALTAKFTTALAVICWDRTPDREVFGVLIGTVVFGLVLAIAGARLLHR